MRLAASSRVSFAAAAVAALASLSGLAAAALAFDASVNTAARRLATTSMMLACGEVAPVTRERLSIEGPERVRPGLRPHQPLDPRSARR